MKKNPLKDCTTIREMFDAIRKVCEDLRGKPFRHWKTTWFVSQDEVRISIDADRTKVPGQQWDTVSWADIFQGDRLYDWPKNTRMRRHADAGGYDVIRIGGGGSGELRNTLKYYGAIELKHLPHIKRLIEKNAKTIARMPLEVAKDHHVRGITTLLRPLQEQVHVTEQELRKHEARATAEYQKEHPMINLLTGKPETE